MLPQSHLQHFAQRVQSNVLLFWMAVVYITIFLAFTETILLGATAGQKKSADLATPVWPPPPEEARIQYLKSIYGPVDVGVRPSVWNRFSNLATGADRGKEKLIKPFGLALDEKNNLWVTDMGTGRIWLFDTNRKRAQYWEKTGRITFVSPVAVAVCRDDIYVADSALQQIIVFNDKGKFRQVIQQEIQRPVGLALFMEKLYVADAALHQIVVYDLNGKYLTKLGKRGDAPGELNFPTHLSFDSEGHLLVTDSMNARIQRFDAGGRYLGQIGSPGDGSGHFSRPKGVASCRFGYVYVVDALFDNFQIFNKDSRFMLAIGTSGSGPGQFWMPAGIVIDKDQQIYIADGYNGRVQVFKYLVKP